MGNAICKPVPQVDYCTCLTVLPTADCHSSMHGYVKPRTVPPRKRPDLRVDTSYEVWDYRDFIVESNLYLNERST